jgi:hypothetical protein
MSGGRTELMNGSAVLSQYTQQDYKLEITNLSVLFFELLVLFVAAVVFVLWKKYVQQPVSDFLTQQRQSEDVPLQHRGTIHNAASSSN